VITADFLVACCHPPQSRGDKAAHHNPSPSRKSRFCSRFEDLQQHQDAAQVRHSLPCTHVALRCIRRRQRSICTPTTRTMVGLSSPSPTRTSQKTGTRAVQGPDCHAYWHFAISALLLGYPLPGFRKTKPDAARISAGPKIAIKTGQNSNLC
jgi:hypothetical protein